MDDGKESEREELFELILSVQAANAGADPEAAMKDVLEAQQAVRQVPDERSDSLGED